MILSVTIASLALAGAQPAVDHRAAAGPDRSDASLAEALRELVGAHGNHASLREIGRTLEDRPIHMLTLATDPARAGDMPSILVLAGMDGQRAATTEVALRMAKRLLTDDASVLEQVAVFMVPRGNPDGTARFRAAPSRRGALNARPVDEDRDRRIDEDGPADLDGDGVITLMRKADPPPGLARATLVVDEHDARILREPKPLSGEAPRYAVWVEGLDADRDGLIAEDGPGGVDPDMNFPARWSEFDRSAGAAPLSESESRALAAFVAEHPRIVAVVALGRHDNIVNVPDARARDASGRMPAQLDEADSALWAELSKSYKEITGQSKATGADPAGSFALWCYLHRGIPSITSTMWSRPEPPKAPETKEDGKDETKSAVDAGASTDSPTTTAPAPAAPGATPSESTPAAGASPRSFEAAVDSHLAHASDASDEATEDPCAVGHDHESVGFAQAAPQGGPPGGARGAGPRRGGAGARGAGSPAQPAAPSARETGAGGGDDVAWVQYSDRDRTGIGFVPWKPFTHPTLGEVEIGGFVAGFRENPPESEFDAIAEKQVKWLAHLASKRPSISVNGPQVRALADGLVRVDLAVTNAGGLPLAMAPGRGEGMAPSLVLRLSAPLERVKSGQRVQTVRSLDPGATHSASWIVEAPGGEPFDVVVAHPLIGQWSSTISGGQASAPSVQPGEFRSKTPVEHPADGTVVDERIPSGGSRPALRDPAWNRYYDMPEVDEMLRHFAEARPDLAKLSRIGTSLEGRPIWLLTVTNFSTGEPELKPAMYVDGSIHANEVQATETVLYSIWYLLKHGDTTPALKELLDRAAFYFVPVVSPDNRASWFAGPATPNSHRTGRQPTDNDGDGLFDEDGPDDLDGDGSIGQMWRKDPFGTHRRNLRDPRLLEPVPTEPRPDGTREYGDWSRAGEEGIDDDGDGRINEDGDGGYDMNRNWPSGWLPNAVQGGAGPWPLFYPETRSIALFLIDRPNLAAGQAFHNAGGMILRGPGAPERESAYPGRDLAVYDAIAQAGIEMLPFYRYLVIHSGLYIVHGGLVNWLAEGLGVVSFTNELWTDQRILQGGQLTSEARQRWTDRVLFGKTWSDWKEMEHPQFGTVLVGGPNKWSARSPPGFMLEEECHRNFAFVAHHAAQMPLLRWESVETKPMGGDLWELTIAVANDRLIPTRTQRAVDRAIGLPDRLVIDGGSDATVIASGVMNSRLDRTFAAQAHRPEVVIVDDGVPGHGSRVIRAIVKARKGATLGVRFESEKAIDLDRTIMLGDG